MHTNFGRREFVRLLGDRFRALGNGVLRKLAGQKQTRSRLNLARCDRCALVVCSELRDLERNLFKLIRDEAVHNAHRLR